MSVALSPVAKKFQFHPLAFLGNGSALSSSSFGSKKVIDMLELCTEKSIKQIIEKVAIIEKSCAETMIKLNDVGVRHRFVFAEYNNAFTPIDDH